MDSSSGIKVSWREERAQEDRSFRRTPSRNLELYGWPKKQILKICFTRLFWARRPIYVINSVDKTELSCSTECHVTPPPFLGGGWGEGGFVVPCKGDENVFCRVAVVISLVLVLQQTRFLSHTTTNMLLLHTWSLISERIHQLTLVTFKIIREYWDDSRLMIHRLQKVLVNFVIKYQTVCWKIYTPKWLAWKNISLKIHHINCGSLLHR